MLPCHCTQPQCPKSKSCVPLVFKSDGDDTQEEEDDAVGQCGHGLDGVLDGRVTLLGDVQKRVTLLCNAASDL